MKPDSPLKKRRRWLPIFVLVVFFIGGLLVLTMRLRPIATVRFPDGAVVKILDAVVAREYRQTVRIDRKWSWNPLMWFSSSSRVPRTGSGSQSNRSFRESVIVSDRERESVLNSDLPGEVLFIAIDGSDAHGKPLTLSSGGENLLSAEIWTGKHGGWRPCFSPLPSFSRDSGFKSIIAPGIFERSEPKVRLRFSCKGNAPIEVAIRNPKPTVPGDWKSDPAPYAKEFSEGTVQLKFLGWKRNKTTGQWEGEVRVAAQQNPAWFRFRLTDMRDASGNHLVLPDFSSNRNIPFSDGGAERLVPGDAGGYVNLPPGNGAWRAVVEISHSDVYPEKFEDCVVLADGSYDAVAKTVQLLPSANLTTLGTVNMTATMPDWSPRASGEVQLLMTCDVTGTVPQDLLTRDRKEGIWRLYENGRILSGGIEMFLPQYGRNGDTYNCTIKSTWRGLMKHGTKFQVATPLVRPPEVVEFTFDPSPLPAE